MGTKYSTTASSGYNASAPPDDGSVQASNKISWAVILTKLTDVLKTFTELVNSRLVTHFDNGPDTHASTYESVAGDYGKVLECTGTFTLNLLDAATATSGYWLTVKNNGTGIVTVDTATAGDEIDGVAAGLALAPEQSATFVVNNAADGYYTSATHAANTVLSTVDSALVGPLLSLTRNRPTPAADDLIGQLRFKGEDSAGNSDIYADVRGRIITETSTAEDGELGFRTMGSGSIGERARVRLGLIVGTHPDEAANDAAGTVQCGDVFMTDTDAGALAGPVLQLYRNSVSPAAADLIGRIQFSAQTDTGGGPKHYASIQAEARGVTNNFEVGQLTFFTDNITTVERLWIQQGVVLPDSVGDPAGGDKGEGTLNAKNGVYDNNALLTCYVFDQVIDGDVDLEKWDARAPGRPRHDPAKRFKEREFDDLDLVQFEAHWREHRHLPAMPDEETFDVEAGLSTGDWIQRLLETAEVQAVHIAKLHERLSALENR